MKTDPVTATPPQISAYMLFTGQYNPARQSATDQFVRFGSETPINMADAIPAEEVKAVLERQVAKGPCDPAYPLRLFRDPKPVHYQWDISGFPTKHALGTRKDPLLMVNPSRKETPVLDLAIDQTALSEGKLIIQSSDRSTYEITKGYDGQAVVVQVGAGHPYAYLKFTYHVETGKWSHSETYHLADPYFDDSIKQGA